MLSPEEKQHFDELDEVFALPGWKHIMNDILADLENNGNHLNFNLELTDTKLHQLRGAQTVLKSFLDYEQRVDTMKQVAEDDEVEDIQSEPTTEVLINDAKAAL